MLATAMISLLIGALLGARYKVYALIPIILLISLFAVSGALLTTPDLLTAAATFLVAICGIQIGYPMGILVRYMRVLERARRVHGATVL